MKHLNFLSKSSSQSCGHSSVTLASTVGSPSAHRRGTMLKLISVLVLLMTLGISQMWGATITFNVKGQGSGNSYITLETQYTSGSTKYKMKNWVPSSGQVRGNNSTNSNNFYIYNTDAIPGTISGISITGGSYTYSKIKYNTATSAITSHTTTNSMSSSSATISNGTGTYFRINFTNGVTSGTQCMTSVTITFCPNPTSLTNGAITANTAHLSWSDSYNTNSYEVYVSTSSTTPAYNETPSATGGSGKTADVTGLNPGTTYNWWVRSKSSDTSKSQWVKGTNFTTEAAVACSNSVALSEGTATNGTINTISEDDLATCSETASDRRVTVTITPAACFNAPDALIYTGDGTATMQGTKTDHGNGTFSYVYQFAQNDNGSGTFGVTCTAKAAGKTVNFDAGPGVPASASLTEDCADAGVTLPTVDVSGLCKGWGTFAGWATEAVNDSNTTSVTVYAAGSNYKPASNNMTLYAVYSKTKGTPESWDLVSAANDVTAGTYVITWDNSYYLPSETADGSNPSVGSGITQSNDKLTNTVTSAMQWTFTGDNTNGFAISHVSGNNTYKLSSTNTAQGISVTTGNTDRTWTASVNATYGMLLHGNDDGTRYLAVYKSGSWRYYATGNSYTGTLRLYKKSGGSTTYYCSDPNCCEPLAQINGSVSLSQLTEGENAGKLKATWDEQTSTNGWADPGIVIKIYEEGNATPVVTSEALANSTTSFTANDFTPKTCTNYYATLTALHGDDASYCAGDLVSAPSANVTTAGYTYVNNSTNVNLVAALPASTCANGGADVNIQFTAAAGYRLPSTDEEIDANVSVTNAGEKDEDWSCGFANDVLTITVNPTKATGNVTITVNGILSLVPEISVSKDEIDFSEVNKGVATSTTFTVEGANLSNNITLSSDEEAFTLDTYSLTQEDGSVALTTITLTANTSTAGEYMGTITISDGNDGATDKTIDVYLTVLETYTVNWYVNGQLEHTQTNVANTDYDEVPSDFSAFKDCEDLTFVGWKEGAIDGGSTTSAPSLANIGTKITADKNYYAVFADGTPGGKAEHSYDLSSSDDNWIATDCDDYFSKPYGMKKANAKIVNKSISDFTSYANTATGISIKVNCFQNNGTGSKMTVSLVDEDGNAIAGTGKEFTPTNTTQISGADDSEVTYSASEVEDKDATGYMMQLTTKDKNVLVLGTSYEITKPAVYTKWYSTCPHVSRVTLSAAEVSNGSISFEQSGSAVTNVRTDGGEDVEVDVVPDPATGYELTGVALSGTAASHASYDAGVITIDADAEGALTVTATFAQKNYTVTMAQTGGASAEISDDQSNKHYEDVITITAEDKEGFIFAGWTASPAVTFANAKALSTTFSMPNGNVTVTAAYTKIYTPAETLALDDLTDSVYVEGVISQVDEVSTQYKNATYWISADGTTTNQIKIYRGKHINKADVTVDNAAQIAVGNKVRVRGKLSQSSNVNQFGQGASYITVLVEKTLSALTIVGDASVTTYDVGDSFDKTGLSLSATYNTGYVQANYTGTTITSNYDAPITFTAGVTSVTVSASEGLINTERVIPVTVSSAVLDHAELASGYQTEFWAKEQYKEPLLNAYLNDEPATVLANVTGESNTTGLNMSEPGNKSVTVTYTRKAGQSDDVEYNFTVKPVVVDEAHAHSVATARAIIDVDNAEGEDLELADESAKTHVIGVVTSVSALTGGKYTIVIKDQTDADKVMTLYQVTLKDGITSVAENDVIIAYGNLYYHSPSSKYEINNTGGQVVAVVRTPNLTVADVAEMEVNFTADLAEADLTIDKDGSNGDITFACTDPAVTIVNNKLHAAAAGDATVTATIAASGIYTEASTTFNVHVIAERTRYAITMDANGGSGTDPEYAKQLAEATVNLPATCPYSKANSAFDAWVVTETESGDAVAVTDGHFTMPAAAVTIKATWNDVETCRISFRVSGEEVATADALQTAEFSLAGVSHPTVEDFEFVGWSETEYAEEVTALPTTINSYTPALNEESKTLYGIYSQVVGGENQHYVLDYADEELGDNGDWGAYATAYHYTAADGGEWTIKAYKLSGMQINTSKSAYIKVPECPANIIQISLTCNDGAKNPVKFCATASDNATSLADGSNTTSQTLDLSSKSVTTGYIIPTGNCQITHIDVEYSGNVTYYTSSPVTRYNVTYAKGDATGVTGICEAQRYAAGEITLCAAPTCADKNFAKWSDGTSLYAAGAQYTLSADVTFTATWTPKPKYTVTYTANGGTGTAPDVEEYMEDETVTVKENEYFSKPGFVYAGWQVVYNDGENDHIITPDEESEFTMVAYNVTIKALWEEPSNQKWVRVESTDELATDGTNYIIVAKVNDAAMGALNGSYYNSIGIVKTGNYLNGPESMTKVTLEEGSEDGKLAMKHGSKYIYSTSMKNIGERDDKFDWTITIADGVATINAGIAGKLQFNATSPRFTTYTSSLQAVAIYREKALTPIDHDGMTEDDVNTYDDVEIGQDKTWTVSGEIEVGDVYMKEGAVIANSAEVTANDLYFKARHGKSNQIFDLSQITVVSNMYYDFQLCDGDLDADYWYSIAVPFDVDLNSGVFQADGSPMTNRVDFEVWGYDTQLRAQTQSNGWKRVSDNMMHAGKAYLIGFNPGQPNIIRLKAAANWKDHLFSGTSMSVESTGSGDHDNWNGLANPSGRYIDVNKKAEVFNNNTHLWDSYDPAALSFNFVVGTAFFVQSADAIMISNIDHHGQYRAPKRVDETKCAYAVRITRDEAESFDNQIIVRASEEATGEYTQGHDMLTMNNATSKTAAMLWTENYGGKRLAIEEAAWLNGTASYALKMFAPAAGTYSISVAEAKANADLYLTYEGNIIWNLSESAYPIDLKKGTTEGYGLLLNAKMPQTPTGVETIDNSQFTIHNCQKVIIDEHVYILRGGEMYDVTGKAVK